MNSVLFRLLYRGALLAESERCFDEFTLDAYTFRRLQSSDMAALYDLLHRQRHGRLRFFNPHEFDLDSLNAVARNAAFLMFGVFEGDQLVGYFFLRCFWNRKCFVGRLIDEPSERKGIGRVMNNILYNTAWRSNFRCYTTVSKSNELVMRSHRRNPHAKVVQELANDYLLIEFVHGEQSET